MLADNKLVLQQELQLFRQLADWSINRKLIINYFNFSLIILSIS